MSTVLCAVFCIETSRLLSSPIWLWSHKNTDCATRPPNNSPHMLACEIHSILIDEHKRAQHIKPWFFDLLRHTEPTVNWFATYIEKKFFIYAHAHTGSTSNSNIKCQWHVAVCVATHTLRGMIHIFFICPVAYFSLFVFLLHKTRRYRQMHFVMSERDKQAVLQRANNKRKKAQTKKKYKKIYRTDEKKKIRIRNKE